MRQRITVFIGTLLLAVIAPVMAGADGIDTSNPGMNCTYTIGYWKNHASAWTTSTVTLGTVTYTKAQALSILNQPVSGNGLISLAQQLIGVKLDIAQGADPTALAGVVASADALIGNLVVPPVGSGWLDPGVTSTLGNQLDSYNSGRIGPGHCGTTPVENSTWGALKSIYR
jgi:hypothetical protein